MALYLTDPDINRLIRELTEYTGENPTEAVSIAVSERLERQKQRLHPSLAEELLRIGRECAATPVLDDRTPEEILGYDKHGIAG